MPETLQRRYVPFGCMVTSEETIGAFLSNLYPSDMPRHLYEPFKQACIRRALSETRLSLTEDFTVRFADIAASELESLRRMIAPNPVDELDGFIRERAAAINHSEARTDVDWWHRTREDILAGQRTAHETISRAMEEQLDGYMRNFNVSPDVPPDTLYMLNVGAPEPRTMGRITGLSASGLEDADPSDIVEPVNVPEGQWTSSYSNYADERAAAAALAAGYRHPSSVMDSLSENSSLLTNSRGVRFPMRTEPAPEPVKQREIKVAEVRVHKRRFNFDGNV